MIKCEDCRSYMHRTKMCLVALQKTDKKVLATTYRENSHHHDTCGMEAKYFVEKVRGYYCGKD